MNPTLKFFFLALVLMISSCKSSTNRSSNPLLNTKWLFVEFLPHIKLDSIDPVPQYKFVLASKEKHRLESDIFEHSMGKYLIKKDKIYLSTDSTVGYDSILKKYKGGEGIAMFYQRRFLIDISGRFLPFQINNQELKIFSEGRVLSFKRLNQQEKEDETN